jgi:hypothetical protein
VASCQLPVISSQRVSLNWQLITGNCFGVSMIPQELRRQGLQQARHNRLGVHSLGLGFEVDQQAMP